MKKITAFLLASLFMTACSPSVDNDKNDTPTSLLSNNLSVSENPSPGTNDWINAVKSVDTSGLYVLWERDLENNSKIKLYIDTPDVSMGYETDHEWMLVYESSDGIYPIFPRKQLWHSTINCEVLLDLNDSKNFDTMHILVRMERNGMINMLYDCIWDKSKQSFAKNLYMISSII